MYNFQDWVLSVSKLVLDGTLDKTWFKSVKIGQNRKANNHSNRCETIENE